ncbi:TSL-kinase interacting protein 1 [Senna tora]|uniref:TSL-kinase interacting protein 1 n=1 Tax=Senna tora TaxID=362788 RepID=A0A834WXB4_9FABA|nr:TSL-kinase interacting protein 1 [Senna tora]
MKRGRSPVRKTVKTSKMCIQKTGLVEVKNSSKGTNRTIHEKHGSCEKLLDENEDHNSPLKKAVGTSPELSGQDIFLTEERRTLKLYPGQENNSSRKMKLQLFPINKGTQNGLEKDGHNPYLELTLGGQKKISSVLKHLGKKWGNSTVAIGEPMLFPYYVNENLSNCRRWTLDDSGITTEVVYAAVGSPPIFRLRYGWFSTHEPKPFCELSASFVRGDGLQSEGTLGGCNTNSKTSNEPDKVEVPSKELRVIDTDSAVVAQKFDNVSVVPVDNEPISSNLEQPSLLWIDSLTNISIGGLLSDASLQGKLDALDHKLCDTNAGTQLNQIISDSLDAFIASQNSHPRQSTEDLRPSILDAEETCHAFPLQKFSSSGINVQTASGKAYSGTCSLDVSNQFKFPNADKANDQDGLPQDPASEKTETDLTLLSRIYDDERSLGLTGISWNDSLGPFDLGMPAQKLTGGDSVSIGGFVR